MAENFTWIPFYKETATVLSTYRSKQKELIELLEQLRQDGLKVTPLTDRDAQGSTFLMEEIDPFTFFGSFNRNVKEDERRAIIARIKDSLKIDAKPPSDFDGIPTLNNVRSRFIGDKYERDTNDVDRLWSVFEAALKPDPVNSPTFLKLFDEALKVRNTNVNLTMGLFWIRANTFLALDQNNRDYLNIKIPAAGLSAQFYIEQIKKARSSNKSFPELSWEAWKEAQKPRQPPGTEILGLPATPTDNVWMEYTKAAAHGHGGKGWEFGTCLWSPSANKSGVDYYALMREPKIDDIVIHINDSYLSGWSRVLETFSETNESPPTPGEWADRSSYYRINLKDYKQFPRPVPLSQFLERHSEEIVSEMKEGRPQGYPFVLHGGKEVRHAQGSYIARCTPTLYEIIKKETSDTVIGDRAPAYSENDFSNETAIPAETIRLWANRLRRKKHIIFQGPPGTGKTFIAERLARLLISESLGFAETLQFHPSYNYEDFMQGIRPVTRGGQLTFEPARGRFMQFCEKAAKVADGSACVLIIDEINRGNLSRIFGELMYLLEYRDKAIPLAGEDRPFGIPGNVYLIGTMNTADRSIALVDYALRRRFSFIHLGPDYDVLRSQLERAGLPAASLVATLQSLNALIGDRNYEVGISFFLKDGGNLRQTLQDIWEGEVESYLEEFFYDQPGKVGPFRWKALIATRLADWKWEE